MTDYIAAERTSRLAAEAERNAARAERKYYKDRAEAAEAKVARLRELVKRAQDIVDPCYPQSHRSWQHDARAALKDTP